MRHGPAALMCVMLGLSIAPAIAKGQDAEPPLPDSRIGHRTARILLLTRPDVLADLGMNADQIKKAQKTATAFWLKADDLKGKPDPKRVEARRELTNHMNRWIETELTPEQSARLDQIDLWWEGPSALVSRPVVAETLKLTKQQRDAIEAALSQREAARAKGVNEERLVAARAMEILTPEQLITWKQVLGREFAPRLAQAAGTARK